ncbi:MAG TPA: protein-L-isoaspartate(D-aspartate) O-methyltransferase [Acetobacteraceae bacterium]|nr:protein-L-isoaspartate(D-aspartate) O-methyltransferase [Acetobacteraceae bacterium]
MDARAELLDEIALEMRETARWTGRAELSPRVAAALAKVRREAFVAPGSGRVAYDNRPLPIGHGQTISQPFVVALMTELLDLRPDDIVLEVGTGSGYQAAVLAELAGKVFSIEVIPELAAGAAAALAAQGYDTVELRTDDGGFGWPERAPFDAIIVTAAAPEIPPALLEQLRPGGRMVIPVGPRHGDQELLLITKDAAGTVTRRVVLSVAFVPLTGSSRD